VKNYATIDENCSWDIKANEYFRDPSKELTERNLALRIKHKHYHPCIYPFRTLSKMIANDTLYELEGWTIKEDSFLKEKINEFLRDVKNRYT
jgi:hypothetical protein